MKLLNSITLNTHGTTKQIELYFGDLTSPDANQKFDLLVASAFPNDYSPVRGTLIGALHKAGISVQKLAENKAIDLRAHFSSWISQSIENDAYGAQPFCKRILCFEHRHKGNAWDLVTGIFQAVMPFVLIPPEIKTIAMPVVASGNQGNHPDIMFTALLESSYRWLEMGMPVEKIMIVEINEQKAFQFLDLMTSFKDSNKLLDKPSIKKKEFDLFLSYAHKNSAVIDLVTEKLLGINRDLNIYIDKHKIKEGRFWQQEIYKALDNSEKVVSFLSPEYLQSGMCIEEYNIAIFRHRNSKEGILKPVYLYSTTLPSYMEIMQYYDCREADDSKLNEACLSIIGSLAKG